MCGIWSSILSFQWPSSFPHCLEEGLVLPGCSLSSTLARTHETLSSSHYIGLALFLAFDWMPDFVIDAASMTPRSICFLFWCYHYHGAPVSYVCFIINQPTLSLAFVSLQIPRSSASWVDLVFSLPVTHMSMLVCRAVIAWGGWRRMLGILFGFCLLPLKQCHWLNLS